MRLLTKIMEEDKADFVFLPCSTAFLFAASKLVNDHKYVAMSAEGGATTLEPKMKDLPYFFQFLNYSDHYQMPVMADLLKELGATTASIIYLDDLHGIEYNAQAQIYFSEQGVKILSSTPVPAGREGRVEHHQEGPGGEPGSGLLVPVPAGERPDLRDHGAAGLQPQSRARRSGHFHPGVLRQLQRRPGRDHVRRRVDLQAERRGQRLLH